MNETIIYEKKNILRILLNFYSFLGKFLIASRSVWTFYLKWAMKTSNKLESQLLDIGINSSRASKNYCLETVRNFDNFLIKSHLHFAF